MKEKSNLLNCRQLAEYLGCDEKIAKDYGKRVGATRKISKRTLYDLEAVKMDLNRQANC